MNTARSIQPTEILIDSSASDDELVAAIAAKNVRAVTILFQRHAATLRAAAEAAIGRHDRTIADDAVQDLFMILIEGRAATFQPARGRALAWLKGIAASAALEHLRGRTSRLVPKKKPKKKKPTLDSSEDLS
jgi:DNA-directed RNA polymerase specialized sigma24 family protein